MDDLLNTNKIILTNKTKPILSETVNDLTRNRYAKYTNKNLLIDSKHKITSEDKLYSKYMLMNSTRYIINLNNTYDKIQKIKLNDFNIYNIKSSPRFTPYILMRLIPIQTNKKYIKSNLTVANSYPDKTKIITDGTNEMSSTISEIFDNSFGKIVIFKPTLSVTSDDYILPKFSNSEIVYQNNPLFNFNKLLVEFFDNEGNLYEDMPDNFFTLQITEREDYLKNTHINSQHGEVNMTGSISTNPFLLN